MVDDSNDYATDSQGQDAQTDFETTTNPVHSPLDGRFTPLQQMPDGTYVRHYIGVNKSFGTGNQFGSHAEMDPYHQIRSAGQPYYPFTGVDEIELALALDNMGASLSALDKLFNTQIVST